MFPYNQSSPNGFPMQPPQPSGNTPDSQVPDGSSRDALATMFHNSQHKVQDHAAIFSRNQLRQNDYPTIIPDDQHQMNDDATSFPYDQPIHQFSTHTPQPLGYDPPHNQYTQYESQVPPSQQRYEATMLPNNNFKSDDSPMQPLPPSQRSQPPQNPKHPHHPHQPHQPQYLHHVQQPQLPQLPPHQQCSQQPQLSQQPLHFQQPQHSQNTQYSQHAQHSEDAQPPDSTAFDPDLDVDKLTASLSAIEDELKLEQMHNSVLCSYKNRLWARFEIDRMQVIRGKYSHALSDTFEEHVKVLERNKSDLGGSEDILQVLQFQRWKLNEKIRDLRAMEKVYEELVEEGKIQF